MTMTVLGIAQAVVSETGLVIPTSIISTTDNAQIQLRNLLYAQARQLRNRRIWPQQKKIYVFNTVNGTASYQLPQDYYAATTGTAWDDTKKLRLIGPMSDSRFTARTRGVVEVTNTAYRIFGPDINPASAGGQFVVSPTPSSAFELSFEYLTETLFLPPLWVASTAYTMAANPYISANGNVYKLDTNGTSSATTAPIAVTTAVNSIIDNTAKWHYYSPGYESIVLDTDLCMFDDDLMVAGLKWRYKQAKKLDWQDDYQAYTTLVEGAVGRWQGSFIGRLDRPQRTGPRYTTPDGGWSF